MGIRIDALDAVVSAQAGDELPAMRAGATVKLTAQQLATFIIALVTDSAPTTLDTLNELAAALGDDPNFATTVTNALALKASLTGSETLTNKTLTAPVINAPQGEAFRGYISGLTLANNVTDATNDIDISAGSASSDGTTPALMTLASALTKRLDASWAVGSGNGGLDTGSIANTTYHVFLIQRSDTGVVDALFSTSPTSPTMPTNYTRKRRIGSIRRVSGAIVAFTQNGDYFKISAVEDRSSTAAAASALLALSVPTGINVRPLLTTILSITTIDTSVAVILGDGTGSSANYSVSQIVTDASTSRAVDVVFRDDFFTNTSAQIYFNQVNNLGTPAASILRTSGWIDTRGR